MDGTATGEPAVPDDLIDGKPMTEAIEAVVESGIDEPTANAALNHVTADGVVTRDAVDDAIADVAKAVATPESRAELAASALDDARAAAREFEEFDIVTARLDRLESRLDRLESDVGGLGPRLDALADRTNEAPLWELAREIEGLRCDAIDAHRRADELATAAESFEEWMRDPDRRLSEVRQDCDALQGSIANLESAFEDAMDGDADDRALVWADATLRARLFALLVEDLRFECEDLRAWAAAEEPADPESGSGPAAVDEVGQLVSQLEDRIDAFTKRLEEATDPDWSDRYGDAIATFEDTLADHEPPIDADHVEKLFAQHREAITRDA